VKPANILIAPDGHAKLADLGIAQAADEAGHTTTGQTLGSVDYFSPEQARGEAAGPQTDVYALGVVLYEMLTGGRPFRGDSPAAIAISRLTAPPPDPRSVMPDLPHPLVLICMRALALDPNRRYRSARGLRTALTSWLASAPEDATAPQPAVLPAVAATAPAWPIAAATGPRHNPTRPVGPAARIANRPPPRPARPDEPRNRPLWPALAAVLLILVVAGFAGQRFVSNLVEAQRSAPGAVALASPTPDVTERPTPAPDPPVPRATPTERERSTPAPTQAPPTPQPTSAPTSPPPATASPAQVASADLSAPEAVTRFYTSVTDGRFDAAYALWSDRMKATYPRQENLNQRFDDTAAIQVHGLQLVSQDGGRAVVAIDFTETYEGGATRRFQGSWELVRAGDRWLLDAPHF
jgi:serine/threonine-protein kinase